MIEAYDDKKTISILKNNTERIIKNIDTSMINETEIFYLYKNETTKNFEIFT